MSEPIIVAFVNFKGGSGKTTSAAFLAHAFYEQGQRVLAVDADPLAALSKWEELSAEPWPFPVVKNSTTNVHRDLPGLIGRRYDAVVVDTPGNVVQRDITASVLRSATHVIIPIAPARVEEMMLRDVVELIQGVGAERKAQQRVMLMMNRTVANTNSLAVFREHYPKYGFEVFPSVVAFRQAFVTAGGENIRSASATAYGDLAQVLLMNGRAS